MKKLPKFNLNRLRKTLLIIVLVIVSFAGGYFVSSSGYKIGVQNQKVTISRELPANRQNVDFSLFWRTWDTLDATYYDKSKLNSADMVYGAIKGLVSAVGDPYTIFLPPSENKVVEEDLQGSFSGVGIQIGFRGARLAVVAPLPNTPAEKAGVKAGDYIVGIKDEKKNIDESTSNITLPKAVEDIRGPEGSTVTLTLLRDGVNDPIVANIVRKSINVPSVITTFVGDNKDVARIQVLKFSADTNTEWDKAVAEVLSKTSVKGVILDLRNNPGGYLQEAVDLASDFLKSGTTVVKEEDGNGQTTDFKVQTLGRFLNMPVVVLINKGSASASEILAGALRDQRKALLIGGTSFGKGTIQETRTLDGGAGLHVTIAKWLTPSGYWVNGKGLDPDIKVQDNPDTTQDEQLVEAINKVLGK
jgi:carboxyl-terminal processing protease